LSSCYDLQAVEHYFSGNLGIKIFTRICINSCALQLQLQLLLRALQASIEINKRFDEVFMITNNMNDVFFFEDVIVPK
jgi:hypothetical protein